MIIETLRTLFKRDLNRLRKEIDLYSKEENLWLLNKEISNSGGNLCLHLVGNLNEFIGRIIGGRYYVRDRDLEFGAKGVLRAELNQQIEETIDVVEKAFDIVDDKMLESDYPIIVFKEKMTYEFFLVHLSSHLTYHLGQINYHRRLLDH